MELARWMGWDGLGSHAQSKHDDPGEKPSGQVGDTVVFSIIPGTYYHFHVLYNIMQL